jgi:hypothetical protein
MSWLKFLILTIVILLSSFGVFGALYFFDPANLRKKSELVAAVKDIESNIEPTIESTTESTFIPENLQWTEATPSASWEPRDSGEVFVFKNKMWIMGGVNGNDYVKENHLVKYWEAPHFNDIWNTEDGVHWQKVANQNTWAPRRSMTVAFFNNKLWMLGGWSPIKGYTNDIWTSNDGVHWTRAVEHAEWSAREGHSLEVFQNKLWLIGGVNYNERQTKNEVWYSENGINWKKVENIPWKPRWDHATEVFNGKLFLTGGMNLAGEIFNDVWMSEDGLSWTLVTDNPPWERRQGHMLISYKDYLWLIGRLNDAESGGKNDVWFSKDGASWQKTINDPPWTGREDFFSAVFKDKIWIFGGMDANWKWRNDVWASEFTQ